MRGITITTNPQVAVCATIHTPTAYCFQQFDRIMLMARGRMVYSGPNSPVALGFFHDLGYKQREGTIVGVSRCRTCFPLQDCIAHTPKTHTMLCCVHGFWVLGFTPLGTRVRHSPRCR